MVIYNVTISIDHSIHDEWLNWMRDVHIPDVLNTGLFNECRMSKILAEEEGGLAYSIQYTAKSMDDYESYQANYAQSLQAEHNSKFGGKYAAFRTLLDVIHHANG